MSPPTKTPRLEGAASKGTSDDIRREPRLEDATTWEPPKDEGDSVASGSIAPAMTPSSLAANLLTGQLPINWKLFLRIFQLVTGIAALFFIFFLFYRDNEIGRLQDQIGLQLFWMKAASVLLFALVVIMFTSIVLWINAKRRKQS